MPSNILQKAAGALAASPLLARGRRLFAKNASNWEMPLSRFEKLWAGSWLILDDYSKGVFPPKFVDQQKAYQAEKDYRFSLPGMSAAEAAHNMITKPFWFGAAARKYLADFNFLTTSLERAGLKPPCKILELGCGSGWMAEFLATMGFEVCGTTISKDDIDDAWRRVKSLEAKGLSPALSFIASPMESVHTTIEPGSFEAVFVYEALHHAFDWHQAVHGSFRCLRSGGWLLLCNEPNVLHTFVSYRVAKLSNTHEIGFSKRELLAELRQVGFRQVISIGPKLHWWSRPHWLLAQK